MQLGTTLRLLAGVTEFVVVPFTERTPEVKKVWGRDWQ